MNNRGLLLGAAALFLLLTIAYAFSLGIRASRGASISGDEPFYLLTTQSLLQDRDLDLVNQYEKKSYESFFDHPDGLWRQSVPLEDGRLLSPHNPGLSVLLIPGMALGGLAGAQAQLLLMAAAAMVLAFLLADRITGQRAICWAMSLVVGLSATAFIYSTEIYPEFPAALVLLACLLTVTAPRKLSSLAQTPGSPAVKPPPNSAARWAGWDGLHLAVGLSALCWLGIKYLPLALPVAGWFLWRAETPGRVTLLALGAASAAVYVWFHLTTFDSLTPYNVNVVYAGLSSVELADEHIEFGRRFYRLWGLFVDRRFGIGRWAPVLLAAVPGLALLVLGDGRRRLVFGLVAIQLLIATFVAITMMGWWFPGRTVLTVLPLLVIPLVLVFQQGGLAVRAALVGLALYSVTITAGLAQAGHAGEVTMVVDPFDLSFPPFRLAAHAFPIYTFWTGETWALTILWLVIAGVVIAATVRRQFNPPIPSSWARGRAPISNFHSRKTCPERSRRSGNLGCSGQ